MSVDTPASEPAGAAPKTYSSMATAAASPAPAQPTESSSSTAKAMPADDPAKRIYALVLDTGPLIKNDPPVDTLRARAVELYTTPAVLAEIRDVETRARIETTLVPFLRVRTPRPESVRTVSEFARKTGDVGVLSRTDLQLVALTYEIAVERGNGEVGKPVFVPTIQGFGAARTEEERQQDEHVSEEEKVEEERVEAAVPEDDEWTVVPSKKSSKNKRQPKRSEPTPTEKMESLSLNEVAPKMAEPSNQERLDVELVPVDTEKTLPSEDLDAAEASDDDDDWITPDNLEDHQARDTSGADTAPTDAEPMDTALLTSDFAMQNVALRANLPVVSPALARITVLKSWVLRCHGCFTICRDMKRQFCPKCGQATLLRASCSTDAQGRFRVHLKRNMQWNNRGNVYSMPKPTHGTASGKMRSDMSGGGKNGWGRSLILAEDQKEYTRAVAAKRREKGRDLMDEDYLPGIMTGERIGSGEKIRVGVGRAINATSSRY